MRPRYAVIFALCLPVSVWAQAPASTPEDDPLGPPTERGIRLTPEMARAVARLVTQQVFVRQHEMDAAKLDEVSEMMARRLMAAAHAANAESQFFVESMITEFAEAAARNGGKPRITPEFGKVIGERLLPLLPTVRGLIRDVGQDVRPNLPIKQQFKLAGELALVSTALDGFEKNMQRWAQGGARPNDDLFSSGEEDTTRDVRGQSKALANARKFAEGQLDQEKFVRNLWEDYLKQTKKFYGLDAAQCATADSIFREYMERTHTIVQTPAWRQQRYRASLWLQLWSAVGIRDNTPPFTLIVKEWQQSMDPINELGNEFRNRLDQIPTEVQRAAADARITAALSAKGFEVPTTMEAN